MTPKAAVRDRLIRLADRLGVDSLYRAVLGRHSGALNGRVLTFHEIAPEEVDAFDRLLDLLVSEFDPVPLGTLVDSFRGDGPTTGPRSVAVTFDDGFDSWLDTVVPSLRAHGVPATFFLTSGFVDAETTAEMHAFARENLRLSPTTSLDWDDVAALAADPLFDIGGHTRTHPDLGAVSPDAIEAEVREDRDRIEAATGVVPRFFAYPFGAPWNVPAAARAAVAASGYDAAFTLEPGYVTARSDPYLLPRDGSEPTFSPALLRARLRGSYDPIKRPLDRIRSYVR
ncbi:polysaccharide deacetylase family protein [Halapricum sp. CBA1109]|uniref:polysaccharide deacetylase family protein n=1 Tax=Halapricum sp. CBA1109 TaxID=2668068 RepID=UPI0012F8CA49|nr:polysaccharide deacetylase family protein [Halapricum sp. CBA1109]MUV88789.1 polysaccharide deacetylase family protein [Halapricum sp. CBA1109]